MAVGDIYQVKAKYSLFGEPMNNVFYYQAAQATSTALDLQAVFQNDVLDAVEVIQPAELVWDNIQVINGMTNADQVSVAINEPGDLIGNIPLPTFMAFAFRRRTGGSGFRYSYKRFAGVVTAQMGAGGGFSAGTINALDIVAVALGTTLVGLLSNYVPVQITGGFKLGTAPTFKQGLTGNWEFNTKPSHQDTRQQYTWVPATP